MFYEALKELTEHGKQQLAPSLHVSGSVEGFLLGGLAGGMYILLCSSIVSLLLIFSLLSFSLQFLLI